MGLGRNPVGRKLAEGDGRTPEGRYYIRLVKEDGKYGRSLGLSYPSIHDALLAQAQRRIDQRTCRSILLAHKEQRRPPWGTPLGGEIYLREGGSDRDWTEGCIALDSKDMDVLFPMWKRIHNVTILP